MRRILQKASRKLILKSLYSEKRYLKNGWKKLWTSIKNKKILWWIIYSKRKLVLPILQTKQLILIYTEIPQYLLIGQINYPGKVSPVINEFLANCKRVLQRGKNLRILQTFSCIDVKRRFFANWRK